jgi:hypothetical protein
MNRGSCIWWSGERPGTPLSAILSPEGEKQSEQLDRGCGYECRLRSNSSFFGRALNQIKIAEPQPDEVLKEPLEFWPGCISYRVKGALRRLEKNHRIWLLEQAATSAQVKPQGSPEGRVILRSGQWRDSAKLEIVMAAFKGSFQLNRQEVARRAEISTAPMKWRPARMNQSRALILERMRQMGW